MATRTVRLDADAERLLSEVRRAKGLSVSAALKQGLLVFRDSLAAEGPSSKPYDIYRGIDLGSGGDARASGRSAKDSIQGILRRKVRR